jgi:hypothetical protein
MKKTIFSLFFLISLNCFCEKIDTFHNANDYIMDFDIIDQNTYLTIDYLNNLTLFLNNKSFNKQLNITNYNLIDVLISKNDKDIIISALYQFGSVELENSVKGSLIKLFKPSSDSLVLINQLYYNKVFIELHKNRSFIIASDDYGLITIDLKGNLILSTDSCNQCNLAYEENNNLIFYNKYGKKLIYNKRKKRFSQFTIKGSDSLKYLYIGKKNMIANTSDYVYNINSKTGKTINKMRNAFGVDVYLMNPSVNDLILMSESGFWILGNINNLLFVHKIEGVFAEEMHKVGNCIYFKQDMKTLCLNSIGG